MKHGTPSQANRGPKNPSRSARQSVVRDYLKNDASRMRRGETQHYPPNEQG